MTKIILATTSPFRIKSSEELQIDFEARSPEVDEHYEARPTDPEELVLTLAQRKVESVIDQDSQGTVIGFDSVGIFKGKILEKPKSKKDAFERVESLSGNSHKFITGIYAKSIETGVEKSKTVETKIVFRKITDDEIKNYLKQDPHIKRYSLGYNPNKYISAGFIERIDGSMTNLTKGIPLSEVVNLINSF